MKSRNIAFAVFDWREHHHTAVVLPLVRDFEAFAVIAAEEIDARDLSNPPLPDLRRRIASMQLKGFGWWSSSMEPFDRVSGPCETKQRASTLVMSWSKEESASAGGVLTSRLVGERGSGLLEDSSLTLREEDGSMSVDTTTEK